MMRHLQLSVLISAAAFVACSSSAEVGEEGSGSPAVGSVSCGPDHPELCDGTAPPPASTSNDFWQSPLLTPQDGKLIFGYYYSVNSAAQEAPVFEAGYGRPREL